jgi:ribonuclease P protein component
VWLRAAAVGGPAEQPAVAYAVNRSVGGAVERNRAKRRLRAAVAAHRVELAAGTAYLFGADRSVLHSPYDVLDRAVGELVRASSELTR